MSLFRIVASTSLAICLSLTNCLIGFTQNDSDLDDGTLLPNLKQETVTKTMSEQTIRDNPENVPFIVKVNNEIIQSLRQGESLTSQIPHKIAGEIDYVSLQNGFAQRKNAETVNLQVNVDKNSKLFNLELKESHLRDLEEGRIVNAKLGANQITLVEISFSNKHSKTTTPSSDRNFQKQDNAEANKSYVTTNDRKKIEGFIPAEAKLSVETEYGSMSFSWDKVAAVMFDEKSKNRVAIVALKNGDRISGKCDLESFPLKTSWGTANIDGDQIKEIKSQPNIHFSEFKTPFGQCWQLTQSRDANTRPLGFPNSNQPNTFRNVTPTLNSFQNNSPRNNGNPNQLSPSNGFNRNFDNHSLPNNTQPNLQPLNQPSRRNLNNSQRPGESFSRPSNSTPNSNNSNNSFGDRDPDSLEDN